jgi:hypothetical protein
MTHSIDTTPTVDRLGRAGRQQKFSETSETSLFKRIDKDFPKTITQQNAHKKQYCRKVVVNAFSLRTFGSIHRDARQIRHYRKTNNKRKQIFQFSHEYFSSVKKGQGREKINAPPKRKVTFSRAANYFAMPLKSR